LVKQEPGPRGPVIPGFQAGGDVTIIRCNAGNDWMFGQVGTPNGVPAFPVPAVDERDPDGR